MKFYWSLQILVFFWGGGCNSLKNRFSLFIALGLSTLLPSFVFSDEIFDKAPSGKKAWSNNSNISIQQSDINGTTNLDFGVSNNAEVTFNANVSSFDTYSPGGGVTMKGIYVNAPRQVQFSGNSTFVFNVGGHSGTASGGSNGNDIVK